MGRFGGSGGMNHVSGTQATTLQGSNYALKMNSPSQSSPSMSSGQASSLLSPGHRMSPGVAGSPRNAPSQFSPAGSLHSPVDVRSSTGNSHSYTNSSLDALQALSEGRGVSLGSSLASLDLKMGNLQNFPVNLNPPPLGKTGSLDSRDCFRLHGEPSEGTTGQAEASYHPEQQKGPNGSSMPQATSGDKAEGHSRLHDSKGQTKLLQLLTTKSNQMEPSPLPGSLSDTNKDSTGACLGLGPRMAPRSRCPLTNQIGSVSNVNLTLGPGAPTRAPINSQMLAQRQTEILNQHLQQRPMHHNSRYSSELLTMRGQGLNMTPSMAAPAGLPAAMRNPQISQEPDPRFPGAMTPRNPLMSLLMVHTQSPMM
jgi:hypothetical protein